MNIKSNKLNKYKEITIKIAWLQNKNINLQEHNYGVSLSWILLIFSVKSRRQQHDKEEDYDMPIFLEK